MQENELGPILTVKKNLEIALQHHLDEAAIARKKIAALEDAINVLRAADADLLARPDPANRIKMLATRQLTLDADPELIKAEICKLLAARGRARMPQIRAHLTEAKLVHSLYVVKKVLLESGFFERNGLRDRTYYTLPRDIAGQVVANGTASDSVLAAFHLRGD